MDDSRLAGSTMYQASTLQALSLGYTRPVVDVEELLGHGDIGLGTFEGVNGEMIVLDGRCYRATDDGSVEVPYPGDGVPFAAVTKLEGHVTFDVESVGSLDALKAELDLRLDDTFSLNSMHVARVDGLFARVMARSETPKLTHHVSLSDLLGETQRDFAFEDIEGTLVCIHFPPYLDGVNAAGWHFHFISADRSLGGHVFGIELVRGEVRLDVVSNLHIQLPSGADFDTYALESASKDEIRKVEQGK